MQGETAVREERDDAPRARRTRPAERIDTIQDLTITFLAVAAVFLFAQTEIFRLGWQWAAGRFQLFPEGSVTVPAAGEPLDAPFRLAVTLDGVRRADLSAATSDPSLSSLRRLFSEALDDPAPLEETDQASLLRALDGPCVWCDFLWPLPVSVLTGLLGGGPADGTAPDPYARAVLLSREGDGSVLWLWDGEDGFLRRPCPVSGTVLEETARRWTGGGAASFAADLVAEDAAAAVSPFSLFLDDPPLLPSLTASSGLSDGEGGSGEERMLGALRFNPMTRSRYPESNGTQVIVENGRSVRIRTNGSVYYQGAGSDDVRVSGTLPGLWEAASGCGALLDAVLSQPDGSGDLYLRQISREGERTVLRFDYHLDGIPVRFADGTCAAEVVLDGGAVSTLELRPRRYAPSRTDPLLLPVGQALGIAALRPGRELSLVWRDTGGSRVSPQWLAG